MTTVPPPSTLRLMTRVLGWMCAGALIAVILATWLAPSFLLWWFTPPTGLSMTFDAPKAIQWGMSRMVRAQVTALVLGAIAGLVVAVLLRRKSATPPPRQSVPSTPQKTTT